MNNNQERAIYKLAKAVCQQWLDDGKPANGRQQVEAYARLIQQMSIRIRDAAMIKHAKVISKEGRQIL